jgi:hypothetical protein
MADYAKKRLGYLIEGTPRVGLRLTCDRQDCSWSEFTQPWPTLADLERLADGHRHVGRAFTTPERLRHARTDSPEGPTKGGRVASLENENR